MVGESDDMQLAAVMLKEYASSIDVEVIDVKAEDMQKMSPHVKKLNASAGFSWVFRRILMCITYEASPEAYVYTLAHEVGHAKDFTDNPHLRTRYLSAIRTLNDMMVLGESVSDDIREIILAGETRAFDNGDDILAEIGVSLDVKTKTSFRNTSMRAYEKMMA